MSPPVLDIIALFLENKLLWSEGHRQESEKIGTECVETSANYYFIRDLYAEHRKNSYNSNIKRANDLNKLFFKVKVKSLSLRPRGL